MTAAPADLAPAVRRLTAPNASAYTYTGTQTYLVGAEQVAVIDPGPDDPAHVEAILAALEGRSLTAILVTHNHRDHSPAAIPLAKATGAPVLGGSPVTADPSYDVSYSPNRMLSDGESVRIGDTLLTAVATPGHTSNHLCFALDGTGALFTGDHAMGWSTSVVIPPDGDIGAYMASLDKLAGRQDRVYYPGHGDPVDDPERWLRATIGHRRMREAQVLRFTGEAPMTVDALVERMYPGLSGGLVRAAGATVLAHLLDLEHKGALGRDGASWERIA